MLTEIVGDDYLLFELIGKGGFSEVFIAKNTFNQPAAIKVIQNKKQAKNEYKLLKLLNGIDGIPQVYQFYENSGTYAIAMEYLGSTLLDLPQKINFKDIKTTAKFGCRVLSILKSIHKKGIVHNDIKPSQFIISDDRKIHLIDFGISRIFELEGNHKEVKNVVKLRGNFLFASINCHSALSLSRRDDLLSAIYMLIFLYKGSLPWEHYGLLNSEKKWQKTWKLKQKITAEKLFEGMPNVFIRIYEYANSLTFKEKPNYRFIYSLLKSIYKGSLSAQIPRAVKITNSRNFKTVYEVFYDLMAETEETDPPEFKVQLRNNK